MRILNNSSNNGGGLGFVGHGFDAVVSNSIISGNTANDGGGIKAELGGNLRLRNTSIVNN